MRKGAVIVALLVVGCSGRADLPPPTDPPTGEGLVVQVVLTEFGVEMDRAGIPVGVPVIFRVSNEGKIDHNLILEMSEAIDEPLLDPDGNPAKIMNVNPGETAELRFAFEQGAEYGLALQFGCHLPGHYEAGMFQEFKVEG
jgi:uncharacterized cupredoxin-like copper-binding protein